MFNLTEDFGIRRCIHSILAAPLAFFLGMIFNDCIAWNDSGVFIKVTMGFWISYDTTDKDC